MNTPKDAEMANDDLDHTTCDGTWVGVCATGLSGDAATARYLGPQQQWPLPAASPPA